MTEKRSLSFQRQSLEHLIALCPDAGDTILEGAKQAALTIGWIERHDEILRILDKLRRERPELFRTMVDLAATFPGAAISDIRYKLDDELSEAAE